jgi:hypothetical protein
MPDEAPVMKTLSMREARIGKIRRQRLCCDGARLVENAPE